MASTTPPVPDPSTPENGAAVRLTLRDIYTVMLSLEQQVADTRLSIEKHLLLPAHPSAAEKIQDHEVRMRVVEASLLMNQGATSYKRWFFGAVFFAAATLALNLFLLIEHIGR